MRLSRGTLVTRPLGATLEKEALPARSGRQTRRCKLSLPLSQQRKRRTEKLSPVPRVI
jgi:hypothetical protein